MADPALHIGIVSSSQGQVLAEVCRAVADRHVSFTVITDRPCGIETVCASRGIAHRRIVESDRLTFSRRAAASLTSACVDFVLLFFNRLVSADLYATWPTFNVHPSLLPAFAGFGALEQARDRRVRFVGATMHLVTEEPDAGPIIAQVCAPVWPPCPHERVADLSFVQRVYLSLLLIELYEKGGLEVVAAAGTAHYTAQRPYTDRCNPAIQDGRMLAFMRQLEDARGMNVTTGQQ